MRVLLARRRQKKRADRLASVFGIYGFGLAVCAAVYVYRPTSLLATPLDFEPAHGRQLAVSGTPLEEAVPTTCRPEEVKVHKSEFPEDIFCDYSNRTEYPDAPYITIAGH